MSGADATAPRWPLPSTPIAHDPELLARAVRDMRLTWRARGILAELATGYPPGQEPAISELTSLTRMERRAAEGRDAFRAAVGELRTLGYLRPATAGVGERLVVDLTVSAGAHLIPSHHHADGS